MLPDKIKSMRIKLLPVLFGACLTACSNAAPPQAVSIKLGPTYFLDGDSVRIESVTSTSPNLEPGDTVSVTGRYRLQSRDKATLALYLTQTKGAEIEETAPAQKCIAKRGWHKFTSVITVKYRGLLHLTFYDCASDKPFGGVYFGTPKQTSSDHGISVDHYRKKL
jgi:hypothetical protein